MLKLHAEPSPPVPSRQASSQEASTSEPGQAAESGSAALEKTSPAAILEDMKRRMGWTAPAAPQQVSDEQQMVQAAEGSDKVADGAEVRLRLFRICWACSQHRMELHSTSSATMTRSWRVCRGRWWL